MSKTEDKENKSTPVTKQLQKATSGFLGGDRMAEVGAKATFTFTTVHSYRFYVVTSAFVVFLVDFKRFHWKEGSHTHFNVGLTHLLKKFTVWTFGCMVYIQRLDV